jgi:hypothetical protein
VKKSPNFVGCDQTWAFFGPNRKKLGYFGPRKSYLWLSHWTRRTSIFRLGPGLGRPSARLLCKIAKNSISGWARAKIFFSGCKICAHPHLVKSASGPGRVGLKMLKYSCDYIGEKIEH